MSSRARALIIFCVLCCYLPAPSSTSSVAAGDDFLRCLSEAIPSELVYPRGSPSFAAVLASSIRNPMFMAHGTSRPLCVATPADASHVQAAVLCGRRHGVRLRVRSGGHDYEGLSYRSARAADDGAFAVVDLAGLRAVRVDTGDATAWVDSGATIGELYYAVGRASDRLAFPAGLCPTIGVGGHLSGGGFGMLLRKYGVAADHIVDAVLVDARGRLLDRDAMGSDVFWAIRGGGGASFGIVLSWKVRLVPVPPTVTAFKVPVSVDQGAVDVVTRWQTVAPALPDDLFIRVLVQGQVAEFQSLYLGTCDALLPVMRRRFPELGVNRTHCREMTWLESVPYIYLGSGATAEDILNRTTSLAAASKATSDYVRDQPIAGAAWSEIFSTWLAAPGAGLMILDPYGAAIGGVPEDATPFPHRGGVLYNIQYMNFWAADGGDAAAGTKWIRDLHAFMEPHVSKDPREAYFNYRDLDLGENVVVDGVSSYEAGKVWGEKYFKGNFRRLAIAKAQIDPDDYFRNEQSIPPLTDAEQPVVISE
ncbi:Cannabidiolic acid synthase-like 2 [Dichanthelium oligosanthes]|uniref:Cannabidiolic acid synthase-like 2 n=1 Tax=Dichanthelium oligosanthes TaxID=888268 RepID=A0A1E5VQN3_9POAL|nr:Cannabidiolic acid synthase-like 2 [Dichanthelium oligosanthes]